MICGLEKDKSTHSLIGLLSSISHGRSKEWSLYTHVPPYYSWLEKQADIMHNESSADRAIRYLNGGGHVIYCSLLISRPLMALIFVKYMHFFS